MSDTGGAHWVSLGAHTHVARLVWSARATRRRRCERSSRSPQLGTVSTSAAGQARHGFRTERLFCKRPIYPCEILGVFTTTTTTTKSAELGYLLAMRQAGEGSAEGSSLPRPTARGFSENVTGEMGICKVPRGGGLKIQHGGVVSGWVDATLGWEGATRARLQSGGG